MSNGFLTEIQAYDVLANRPAAAAANEGYHFHASDEGITYRSNGSSWDDVAINEAAHAAIDHTGLPGVGAGGGAIDVACRVRRVADQAMTNGSLVYVSWDAEDYDHSTPMHDLVTNPTRITVPTGEGGKYRVDCAGYLTASSGNGDTLIRKNGSTFIATGWWFAHSSISGAGVSAEFELAAGDYIEWGIRVGASSKNLIDGGALDPYLTLRRIA